MYVFRGLLTLGEHQCNPSWSRNILNLYGMIPSDPMTMGTTLMLSPHIHDCPTFRTFLCDVLQVFHTSVS